MTKLSRMPTLSALVLLSILLAPAASAATLSRIDTRVGDLTLRMDLEGQSIQPFRLVEPLTEELGVIEFQDGDDITTRKRPGRLTTGTLVIGVPRLSSGHPLLRQWLEVRQGVQQRKTVTLNWIDGSGRSVQSVVLYDAWPSVMSVQPNGEWFIRIVYENSAYQF